VLQGVVGGLRVVLQTEALAMIHGPLAQAFFALTVTIALLTSPRMAAPALTVDATTRRLTLIAAATVYLQIVFGALLTHAGYLGLHLAGALAVFALVPIVTARLRHGGGDPVAAPAATATIDAPRVGTRPPAGHAGRAAPATMTPRGEVVVAALARERGRVAGDLLSLTKPRVVLMVLVTTVVGYYVGLAGAPDYARLAALLLGTMLAAGGTLALNQYWERDVDALMERTRTRPLPEGRLAPLEALLFGGGL